MELSSSDTNKSPELIRFIQQKSTSDCLEEGPIPNTLKQRQTTCREEKTEEPTFKQYKQRQTTNQPKKSPEVIKFIQQKSAKQVSTDDNVNQRPTQHPTKQGPIRDPERNSFGLGGFSIFNLVKMSRSVFNFPRPQIGGGRRNGNRAVLLTSQQKERIRENLPLILGAIAALSAAVGLVYWWRKRKKKKEKPDPKKEHPCKKKEQQRCGCGEQPKKRNIIETSCSKKPSPPKHRLWKRLGWKKDSNTRVTKKAGGPTQPTFATHPAGSCGDSVQNLECDFEHNKPIDTFIDEQGQGASPPTILKSYVPSFLRSNYTSGGDHLHSDRPRTAQCGLPPLPECLTTPCGYTAARRGVPAPGYTGGDHSTCNNAHNTRGPMSDWRSCMSGGGELRPFCQPCPACPPLSYQPVCQPCHTCPTCPTCDPRRFCDASSARPMSRTRGPRAAPHAPRWSAVSRGGRW